MSLLGKRSSQILLSCTFFFLLLAAACGTDQARIAPLGSGAVVLAFGDSLTYGTGAARQESYPSVLGDLLQRRVVNAGVPGEVSAEGLARLSPLLDRHRPSLVILCHGGNDILRRLDPARLAGNLRSMIELARDRGADVVLVGVPRPGLFPATAELYEEIAAEFRLPYEGDILVEVLTERDLKSDPIHPNARGYEKMARALAKLIERAQGG